MTATRSERLEQARRALTAASARISELSEALPQPLVGAADVIRSLTDEQRHALLRTSDELIRVVSGELTALHQRLDDLTLQSRGHGERFREAALRSDRGTVAESVEWFEQHDDEVGVLKATIEEFDSFRALLEGLPTERPVSEPPAC